MMKDIEKLFPANRTLVGIVAAVAVTLVLMLAGYGLLSLFTGLSNSVQRNNSDDEQPEFVAEDVQGTRDAFLRLDQPTATPLPVTQEDVPSMEATAVPPPTATPVQVVAAQPQSAAAPAPIVDSETDDDDDGGIADAPDDAPAYYDGWAGDLDVDIATPIYLADGRWAEVFVTVENIDVEPGLPTGFTYLENNEGGGWHLVSLFRADHFDVPQVKGDNAPLWWTTVRFTDNTAWRFPVGCLYIEVLHAEGWEPIYDSEDGYNWEVHEAGGWFDCGNSHDKIPDQQFLAPGEAATVPLYVYLQHPRDWLEEAPPRRQIATIEVEIVRWNDGAPLGIVATWSQ